MKLDLSKMFKNGNNFKFKDVDYSSQKVKKELSELSNQKREIEKTTDYSVCDLERITLNNYKI
jgi:hypothetical protein